MKKITFVLLALACALMLASCADTAPDDGTADTSADDSISFDVDSDKSGDESTAEDTATDTQDTDEITSDEEETTEDDTSAEDTEEDTVEDPLPPETGDAASVFGYFDGTSYINEYFGFACGLGTADYVASDEELAAMSGTETLEEALSQTATAYLLYATAGTASITVTVEDLGILYGATLGEQEYLDIALPQLVPALEAIGLTDVTYETETVEFAGEEHPAVFIYGLIEGVDFYETLVVVKNGQYITTVVAGSYGDSSASYIIEGFYKP